MSQTLYDLELAHRHIEELTRQRQRYQAAQPPDRRLLRSLGHGLGRGLIRAGEALGGREPRSMPTYTTTRTASQPH
ncbi:MAG TPA: hypothetical protein VGR16_13825 [Thermomicrobiales bacterium]|nr:hypothetical protein [Thermomicrobiales bacterium]